MLAHRVSYVAYDSLLDKAAEVDTPRTQLRVPLSDVASRPFDDLRREIAKRASEASATTDNALRRV
jgi:hypothetical protein